eukprot:1496474-Pleurochrysis_carterae.AAC.1
MERTLPRSGGALTGRERSSLGSGREGKHQVWGVGGKRRIKFGELEGREASSLGSWREGKHQ